MSALRLNNLSVNRQAPPTGKVEIFSKTGPPVQIFVVDEQNNVRTLAVKPTPVQSTPADPTGTASTTGVMMGLAVAITPVYTGNIYVHICGNLTNSTATAGDGAKAQIRMGTGAAPANAAALVGTAYGSVVSSVLERAVASDLQPFCACAIVTGLTISAPYWIDISLTAIVGGTALAKNLSVTAFEL